MNLIFFCLGELRKGQRRLGDPAALRRLSFTNHPLAVICTWAHDCLATQFYLRVTLFIHRIEGMGMWQDQAGSSVSQPVSHLLGRRLGGWRVDSSGAVSLKLARTWGLRGVPHWSCLSIFEQICDCSRRLPNLFQERISVNSTEKARRVLSELVWLPGFIWFLIFSQFKPECQSFLSSIYPADFSTGGSVLIMTAPARLSHLPIDLINTKQDPKGRA